MIGPQALSIPGEVVQSESCQNPGGAGDQPLCVGGYPAGAASGRDSQLDTCSPAPAALQWSLDTGLLFEEDSQRDFDVCYRGDKGIPRGGRGGLISGFLHPDGGTHSRSSGFPARGGLRSHSFALGKSQPLGKIGAWTH